jgi:hypothetical protein
MLPLFFSLSYRQYSLGFSITENTIERIRNLTPKQQYSTKRCADIHSEVDKENGPTAQDANIRGISVSASR